MKLTLTYYNMKLLLFYLFIKLSNHSDIRSKVEERFRSAVSVSSLYLSRVLPNKLN